MQGRRIIRLPGILFGQLPLTWHYCPVPKNRRGAPRKTLDIEDAVQAIGARAFEALRDPRTAGVLPAAFVAEKFHMHRSTVANAAAVDLARGSVENPTAPPNPTPFDNVMAHYFDWERNGGKAQLQFLLGQLHQFAHTSPEDAPQACRFLLGLATRIALEPTNPFLTQLAVSATALEYLGGTDDGLPYSLTAAERERREENAQWARWLLDKRREELAATAECFTALLSLTLRVVGRRPRVGYTTVDLVDAMQSLWNGMVFRLLMDNQSFDVNVEPGDGRVEKAMWDLAMGMTEPSVLGLREESAEPRPVGVESVLGRLRSGDSVQTVDEETARACVDDLLGRWAEVATTPVVLEDFAAASLPIVEGILVWIGRIASDYNGLLQAARFGPEDPTYREVLDLLSAALLADSASHDSIGSRGAEVAAAKRARQLLSVAVSSGDLERALAMALPKTHPFQTDPQQAAAIPEGK